VHILDRIASLRYIQHSIVSSLFPAFSVIFSIMGLHPALEVKAFDTYGFSCRGLFVKQGCTIRKGERVWWFDRTNDAALRTYSKRDILMASTVRSSPPPSDTDEAEAVPEASDCAGQQLERSTRIHVQATKMVNAEPKPAIEHLPSTRPSKDRMEAALTLTDLREILTTYSYMLDDDCYASTHCALEDVSYYYNHSCTANTAYSGDDLILALCDIGENEQVVYDYAFTETQDSMHVGMNCKCGTAECRGKLDFLQYKNPGFIAKHYGHCTSFIQRKMRENGWVHDSVVRRRMYRDGTWSHGLFACKPIPHGTAIISFSGKVIAGKHIESVSRREQEMSLQIDDDLWQIPNNTAHIDTNETKDVESNKIKGGSFETGDYINHSCSPNCGMSSAICVVTMRDIAVDEALTIEYAMVNTGRKNIAAETFECHCGDGNFVDAGSNQTQCRGVIAALDYQKVGHKYFHFLSPFVRDAYLNHINAHSHKATDSNGMGELEALTVGFTAKVAVSHSNESVSEDTLETSDISSNLSSQAPDKESSFATTDVAEATPIGLAPIQSTKARFLQEQPSDLTIG
jgi:uncharacterized protein